MTAVGCGTVEVNPPQHSIKRREKCGLNALLGEQAYPNKVRGVWGKMVAGERFIRSPPSISAFSPSAALLAEATRRLAGYAHNYPGLRRFAAGP